MAEKPMNVTDENQMNMTQTADDSSNMLNPVQTHQPNEDVVEEPQNPTIFLSSTQVGQDRCTEFSNRSMEEISKTMEKSTLALTMASIKIESCIPPQGETEISLHTYNRWKDLLLASIEALPGLSESEKFAFFKRSAGNVLLDIVDGLFLEQPSALSVKPFSDVLTNLDAHFSSSQNKILQIVNFRAAKQNVKESATLYLSRMLRHAKESGFSRENLEKELIFTIASNTCDDDLQKKALESGCTFQKLKEQAKMIDLLNTMKNAKKQENKKNEVNEIEVQAVSFNKSGLSRGRQQQHPLKNRSKFSNNHSRGKEECSRCGYSSHTGDNCPNINKKCNACNRIGHFAKMCRSRPPMKRSGDKGSSIAPEKDGGPAKKFKREVQPLEVSQVGSDSYSDSE